jgi:hypothetical protein
MSDLQQQLAKLQQQSAMQQLEIMRLHEALHEIKYADDSAYYVCEKIAERALATTATHDDLMAWHEAQLGEPVAWLHTKDWYTTIDSPVFDEENWQPLYTKKG